MEVRPALQLRISIYLGPKRVHAEIVAPDLTSGCALQNLGLKGRLAIDAWTGKVRHRSDIVSDKREPADQTTTLRLCLASLLTVLCALGLTKRVDHTFLLLRYAVHAADPLASVTHCANSLDTVGTLERRDEEVPWDPDR